MFAVFEPVMQETNHVPWEIKIIVPLLEMNVLSSGPTERVFTVAENDLSVCWLRSNMTAGMKVSATRDASIMASQLNRAMCRDRAHGS